MSRFLIATSYLHRRVRCIGFTAETAAIFEAEENEMTVAYSEVSAIQYQHHIADMGFHPPHSEQWEKRGTADDKHVMTKGQLGWHYPRVKQESNG